MIKHELMSQHTCVQHPDVRHSIITICEDQCANNALQVLFFAATAHPEAYESLFQGLHIQNLRGYIQTIIQSYMCDDEGDITCVTFAPFEWPST
jgi:hypothetical protein